MPGIYIQDGGAIGSSLAQSINQIAQNYNPRNIAEAGLVKRQTEEADWNNRLLSSKVPAIEQGALGAGQMADAIPSGGVAGAIAAKARNPSMSYGGQNEQQRGVIDTASMSPMARVLAGRYFQGAGTDEITKGLDYQHDVAAPGSDPTTQTQLYKERASPVAVSAGTNYVLNPLGTAGGVPQDGNRSYTYDGSPPGAGGGTQPGVTPPAPAAPAAPAAPGSPSLQPPAPAGQPSTAPTGVIQGPSTYDQTMQTETAKSDQTHFTQADQEGQMAEQTAMGLTRLRDMYNQLGNDNTATGQGVNRILQEISQQYGVNLSDKASAMAYIQRQMAQQMGPLRQSLGFQRVTNFELQQMQNLIANPGSNPALFNAMIDTSIAAAKQLAAHGQAARAFVLNPTWQNRTAAMQAEQALAGQDFTGGARQLYPQLFAAPGAGGQQTAAPPPQTGEVQEGYRFKGGNPGDPNSWEKVQ